MSMNVIHALDQVVVDVLSGYMPINVVTLIDAIGWYRQRNNQQVVTGLSEMIESKQGIGSMPVMGLFF